MSRKVLIHFTSLLLCLTWFGCTKGAQLIGEKSASSCNRNPEKDSSQEACIFTALIKNVKQGSLSVDGKRVIGGVSYFRQPGDKMPANSIISCGFDANYLIEAEVLSVNNGVELLVTGASYTFVVHSPSLTLMHPEPIGKKHELRLAANINDDGSTSFSLMNAKFYEALMEAESSGQCSEDER